MAARADLSTNAQGTESQSSAPPKGVSIALIGPNDAHRQVVARALASGPGRKVHEFIDYPASLEELARMMETKFDVVLVDVDTDESYALQIIAKLSNLGPTVMAYSARTDEDLLATCMRAGASDFLPLPEENLPVVEQGSPTVRPAAAVSQPATTQPAPVPQPAARAAAPVQQPVQRPVVAPQPTARVFEPKPAPAPAVPVSRANVTPMAPQKFAEPGNDPWTPRIPETRFSPEPPKVTEAPAKAEEPIVAKENVDADFAAWDAANLRRIPPPQSVPEPSSRPALVTEKRKSSESMPRIVPPAEESIAEAAPAPPPAQVIERPPISADIFRSTTFSEPSEAVQKQGAKWLKWVLIGGGPVVLGLVLLIVFTRSSTQNSAVAAAKATAATAPTTTTPAPATPDPTASDRLIVNATGKPAAGVPVDRPNAGSAALQPQTPATGTETQEAKDVSPDAMAAQLVAPTRIAGQINTKAAADEPPPAAPSAVSLEDNNSVSGSVFGAGSKIKVTPHVVPISEGLAAGMLIHKTTPIYPKYAQEAHITGTVVIKATITKQGTIEGIQVLSGPKILAPSAVDAVKTWKYRPYMLDGQPVAVETDIKVVFGGQ